MHDLLHILQPEHLPTNQACDLLNRNLRKRCVGLHLVSEPWDSVHAATQELYSLVDELPANKAADSRSAAGGEDDEHDNFFHVKRVDGDRPELLFRSIVWANWMLLRDVEESQSQLSSDKLNTLDLAFKVLESSLLGVPISLYPRVRSWKRPSTSSRSMHRWIRGHQIFAALTQGLIVSFTELRSALMNDDAAAIARAVDLAVILLNGSAASLEFTGDMPSDDYVNIIRPSMTPPLVPETFSGLLSTDHRRFIQLLREMKPDLDSLQDQFPIDHQRIAQAVQTVYDSHKFVCERLVGKSPSLMMSSASSTSGADQIERFKKHRMKLFERDPRPVAREESA